MRLPPATEDLGDLDRQPDQVQDRVATICSRPSARGDRRERCARTRRGRAVRIDGAPPSSKWDARPSRVPHVDVSTSSSKRQSSRAHVDRRQGTQGLIQARHDLACDDAATAHFIRPPPSPRWLLSQISISSSACRSRGTTDSPFITPGPAAHRWRPRARTCS